MCKKKVFLRKITKKPIDPGSVLGISIKPLSWQFVLGQKCIIKKCRARFTQSRQNQKQKQISNKLDL